MQAGLSGAIAIHAIYTLDETVLFFERPHVGAANSGVTPNPYLSVSDLSPGITAVTAAITEAAEDACVTSF